MNNSGKTSIIFLIFISLFCTSLFAADLTGRYKGKLITEWLSGGRNMKLTQGFSYLDARGNRWSVPKGTIVDGASIPTAAWSFIGSPFNGKYRNASVIHDYFCQNKKRPWRKVHRVFYEAMRTSGVDVIKSKIMYAAVYSFGPRWETATRSAKTCIKYNNGQCVDWKSVIIETPIVTQHKFYAEDFKKLQHSIINNNISLKDIDQEAEQNILERDLMGLE